MPSDWKSTLFGIREKLIGIFVVIKVLPLIALAVFASREIGFLGSTVKSQSGEMLDITRDIVGQVGDLASESSIAALDRRSRESIERLTTDTAQKVARFLYERDDDILMVAHLPKTREEFENFLKLHRQSVISHPPYHLSPDGSRWLPPEQDTPSRPVRAKTSDNKKDFHYRPPQTMGQIELRPIYHEITLVDLNGQERLKVSSSNVLGTELRDISDRSNTWCKAEGYFKKVQSLQEGEIYVSRVIGPYLSSPLIGPYTQTRAREKKIPFAPELAAYAGKENPVGKRFQGIIRWVTPVFESGVKTGYVTLALDHTHLMEFTDHLVPTSERYSDISDAGSGNYAFMWDEKGRNISHPRDYFIVGFNPETGEQEVPWLAEGLYQSYTEQGSFAAFEKTAPVYQEQSLEKKPARQLTAAGKLGLDCRYLNFAPQCSGWKNLTQYGGSGSFVIFWSKLWKLTTAAAIPYYTGDYGRTPRGFGFVTIGANVDEFHASATETATLIKGLTGEFETGLDRRRNTTLATIDQLLRKTIHNLTISTLIMVAIVIFIAIWMASILSGKITNIIRGLRNFQSGDHSTRLQVTSQDELGQIALAFNEMSDTVEGSIEAIRSAKERAEESDKAKSLFLANMSHEIRTPMSAIIGMSSLALEASEDEKQKKLLDSVKTSADSLLAVINDILDFSKIEAGQLDLEHHVFSLHGLVQSVTKSVSVLAEGKDLEVGYGLANTVPDLVSGDNMRLRQILLNLLGNAVKFTRRGVVSLEVRKGAWEDGRGEIHFKVRDTGPGIDTGQLDLIFDNFSQGDVSISRKHQGAGLGLAISRKLCRLMGGDIRVESEPGMGSTFSFHILLDEPDQRSIPVNIADGPVKAAEAPVERDILLVEDNEANRELARMILEGAGHHVVTAESGIHALYKLTERSFDAILMDIQMPEMDGFTATGIIRASEKGEPPPSEIPADLSDQLHARLSGNRQRIIALTAHAMKGDRERCMAAGMDGYLTKPFQPDQVVNALQSQPAAEKTVPIMTAEISAPEDMYQRVRQNLVARYQLNQEEVESLLATSVKIIRKDMKLLTEAADKKGVAVVRARSHSLKGILLNLTLEDEAGLATELQAACDRKDVARIGPLVERLTGALAEFL